MKTNPLSEQPRNRTGVAAAITAGGKSRRFGQDKALYAWHGVSLLNRVAASMEKFTPRLLIAPEGKYILAGWTNRSDFRPGEGPLAGLETALTSLSVEVAAGRTPVPVWLAFCAVDMPNLTAEYWTLLADRAMAHRESTGVRAVLGLDGRGLIQPLAGLYHIALLPVITTLLNAGERRMQSLVDLLLPATSSELAEFHASQGPRCELIAWNRVEAVCPDAYENFNTPPQ